MNVKIRDKIALSDAEGYLVCSICARRFEHGDVCIGQIKIEVQDYSKDFDFRTDPPIRHFPVNQETCIYLPHFHERCLL